MKLILRNLRGFLLHHTGFFVLMLCCVLSSAVIMLFSFGLYQNYRLEREEYTAAQLEMQLDCSGVTKAELQAVVELISSSTHENINLIAAEVRDGAFWTGEWKHELFTRFVYRSGSYHAYAEIEDNMLRHGDVQNGRFYTDTEYQSGARVMIVSQDEMYARLLEAEPELANAEVIEMPDVSEPIEAFYPFSLCGEQFTPIMRLKEGSPDVPFPAIPGQAQITHVYILFSVPPKPVQVRDIYTAVQQVCGDRVKLPDYVPADEEDYTLYSTVMLIAVLIACAAAVNTVVLYDYILLKRRRALAVFMLCGCTRARAVMLYLGESLLLTMPLFALAAIGYHTLLLPLLKGLFPYIATAYSPALYARAMGIYVAACTVGMLGLSVHTVCRRSVREIQTGGAI